jgi:hypothetical protein
MPGLRLEHSIPAGVLLALLMAGGCTRAPRPAAEVGGPPVFPVVGDTSEVLSGLPEPVTRPRPAAVVPVDSSDATEAPAGPADTTLADTARADTASAAPTPAAADPAVRAGMPPPGSTERSPGSAPAGGQVWRVQLFASADRAAAYREAQRAARALALKDDEMTMTLEGRLWKVRAGAPGPREQAQALLERARRDFPKAFLVPAAPAGDGQ